MVFLKAVALLLAAPLSKAVQVQLVAEEIPDEGFISEEERAAAQSLLVVTKAESLRKARRAKGLPEEAGCFVRTPTGCPKHPSFSSLLWKHEHYGERSSEAKVNRSACEVTRKEHVMHWCGTEDIDMVFIADPGCYVRMEKGCPNHPAFNSTTWKHEEYGEKHKETTANRTQCEVVRKAHIAHWCGAEHDDVQMWFVSEEPEEDDLEAESSLLIGVNSPRRKASRSPARPRKTKKREIPVEPGCFVRTPSGCPNHPNFASADWKHEEYGERYSKAHMNQSECELMRKGHVANWCGVADVQMLFVPGFTESPSEPGCFVRTPKGCPRHPSYHSHAWKHEVFGETYTLASVNRTVCEISRKAHVAHWCGTDHAEMMFISEPEASPVDDSLPLVEARKPWNRLGQSHTRKRVERPTEPGCFVLTPSGCPNHMRFSAIGWQHELYGEQHGAKVNRTHCEVNRKAHVAHWCGTTDVEMLFLASVEEPRVQTPMPREPGCHVLTPTGCPRHPAFSATTWQRERWGETYANAKNNRSTCEKDRLEYVRHWCGAPDARTHFVASSQETAPADPIERGCYVWTPSGCKNHPKFNADGWRHDLIGEITVRADKDKLACEVTRRVSVSQLCGITDVRMKFVDATEASQNAVAPGSLLAGPFPEGSLMLDDDEADLEASLLAASPIRRI